MTAIGSLLFLSFIICLRFGIPLAFSMGLSGLIGLLSSASTPLIVMPQRIVVGVDSFPLLAIPFFLLAGTLINAGGLTIRLFGFANAIVGPIRGGLAQVNVIGSMLFAGTSGSAVADAAGLGNLEIRAMRQEGYPANFSAALTAASAIIGPIIPPPASPWSFMAPPPASLSLTCSSSGPSPASCWASASWPLPTRFR